MSELGKPYDPHEPNEERTVTMTMRTADLTPLVDTNGGVPLADREGVFALSFKCYSCTLHFVLFSWSLTRHTPDTIGCPECGVRGRFMHRITQLSTSRVFSLATEREPEIYDVWPFRPDGGR